MINAMAVMVSRLFAASVFMTTSGYQAVTAHHQDITEGCSRSQPMAKPNHRTT
jgi:hypothetical protein